MLNLETQGEADQAVSGSGPPCSATSSLTPRRTFIRLLKWLSLPIDLNSISCAWCFMGT